MTVPNKFGAGGTTTRARIGVMLPRRGLWWAQASWYWSGYYDLENQGWHCDAFRVSAFHVKSANELQNPHEHRFLAGASVSGSNRVATNARHGQSQHGASASFILSSARKRKHDSPATKTSSQKSKRVAVLSKSSREQSPYLQSGIEEEPSGSTQTQDWSDIRNRYNEVSPERDVQEEEADGNRQQTARDHDAPEGEAATSAKPQTRQDEKTPDPSKSAATTKRPPERGAAAEAPASARRQHEHERGQSERESDKDSASRDRERESGRTRKEGHPEHEHEGQTKSSTSTSTTTRKRKEDRISSSEFHEAEEEEKEEEEKLEEEERCAGWVIAVVVVVGVIVLAAICGTVGSHACGGESGEDDEYGSGVEEQMEYVPPIRHKNQYADQIEDSTGFASEYDSQMESHQARGSARFASSQSGSGYTSGTTSGHEYAMGSRMASGEGLQTFNPTSEAGARRTGRRKPKRRAAPTRGRATSAGGASNRSARARMYANRESSSRGRESRTSSRRQSLRTSTQEPQPESDGEPRSRASDRYR